MSKHTPGPWDWAVFDRTEITALRDGRRCFVVTDMYDEANAPTLDELESNARLIAAAPDLLAALQALMDSTDLNVEEGIDDTTLAAMELARAAISKVTA